MSKNNQVSVDWEKEFDAKFGVNSIYPLEVKDFIRKLLAQRDKDAVQDRVQDEEGITMDEYKTRSQKND